MKNNLKNNAGSVLPLVAVSLVIILLCLAFVIDLGWVYVAKSDLQTAAQSAAIAGAYQLVNEYPTKQDKIDAVKNTSIAFAYANKAANKNIVAVSDDVSIGVYSRDGDPAFTPNDEGPSVQVITQLSDARNGRLSLFLGGITGRSSMGVSATAIATVKKGGTIGFDIPTIPGSGTETNPDPDNPDPDGPDTDDPTSPDYSASTMIPILPITLYIETWRDGVKGEPTNCVEQYDDLFAFNKATGTVTSGSDGVKELKLYPNKEICNLYYQGTSTKVRGNFGLLKDFNQKDLTLTGLTIDELSDPKINGLLLDKDASGTYYKWFNGKPGLIDSLGKPVATLHGKICLIPLFDQVKGSGNNAEYRVVGFGAVRIMGTIKNDNIEELKGASAKSHIPVQPVNVVANNAILDPNGYNTDIFNIVSTILP